MTNISYIPSLRGLIFSVIHCASAVSKTKSPAPWYARGRARNVALPVHPWSKRLWSEPRLYTAAARFSAADLPVFWSRTISYESFCPSLRFEMPARSTALMWTNTSLLPSSGWMKPKPLMLLNHFTVPLFMGALSAGTSLCVGGAQPLPVEIEFGMEVVRQARFRGEASSFGRNSMFVLYKQL